MVNVPKLKARLREYAKTHGLEVPKGFGVVAPTWGKPAQTLAWRVSGHLAEHGKMKGPTTSKAELWEHFFPPTFGELVVTVARAEVGTKEHPPNSNDGPRVHMYQSSTGAYRQAWCASFCTWCYKQAAAKAKKRVQYPSIPAWVPSWTETVRTGQRGWKRVEPRDARAGDIVCLWHSGHIELVVRVDGDALKTIGGNTSPVGRDANGGMVAECRRGFGEVTVVGRLR